MADRLPPLNALKAFESAARHMSLKRAAQELSVTPAAVSHQVKALEDYLGVKLFRRLNRTLELTPAARAALPKLTEGFERLGQGVGALRAQPDAKRLTVSAAPTLATRWLMPRLHRFFRDHPGIDVRVSARVRLPAASNKGGELATIENWLEESDAAILYGRGDHAGLHIDKLLGLTLAPICSPKLVSADKPLQHPDDLQHHTLLHDDTGILYDDAAFWDVWLKAAGADAVDSNRGSHFSHPLFALEAARDGLGVVATFPLFARSELSAGRLVMPFALEVPLQSAYYLVSHDGVATREPVALFREWLLAEAANEEASAHDQG
jgi:LysR family glycine cleavage system transcriptional activator